MNEQSLLAATGVTKSYGETLVLKSVSVDVPRGKITALIGPNGAGKTTLFDIIAGFLRADGGRIMYRDRDISPLAAYRRAREGIVRTFQLPHEFGTLTVEANLLVAAPGQIGEIFPHVLWRRRSIKQQEAANRERAARLLQFLQLTDMRDTPAAALPVGQKKLLELARALMLEPEVLMLDEPLAGVPAGLASRILEHLIALRDTGLTLLVVEHNLEAIMKISDVVYVLVDGDLIASGSPHQVQHDERVQTAYLGIV